jgi:hypothetical protein
MRRIVFRAVFPVLLPLVLAITVGACDSSSGTTTTTTPTTPTTASTTETFADTVRHSGSKTYPFAQTTAGTITISLTSVSPLSTMALGVSIGTWGDPYCSAVTKNENARAGQTAISGTATAGNYCIQVYDSGNIPSDWVVTYTVQVVHY